MPPIRSTPKRKPFKSPSARTSRALHRNSRDEARTPTIQHSTPATENAQQDHEATPVATATRRPPGSEPISQNRQGTALPATSHTEPQFQQAFADQWTNRQSLTTEYDMHKRSTKIGLDSLPSPSPLQDVTHQIDPVAQQIVGGMNISRFVKLQPSDGFGLISNVPSRPLFYAGAPQEDLTFSLRNFVAVDPVQAANVVYTRVAIKEGCAMAGYVPALPQPRRVIKNEEATASEAGDGSEVFGG